MVYFIVILGSKWQSRRKILTPAFHFNILQQFVEILIKEGENMTRSLKNAECTVTKDLLPFISEHTLNAICGIIFYLYLFMYRKNDVKRKPFLALNRQLSYSLETVYRILQNQKKIQF